MYKILAVDDSTEIHELLKIVLTPLNGELVLATSVAEADQRIKETSFDLFILDLHLLDGDGLDLLSHIRQSQSYKTTPVIILSQREDIVYKLSAFSLGADDYMTKPFNQLELKARVETALRRIALVREAENVINAGPFILEPNKQVLQTKEDHKTIHLTPTEFKILSMLARKPEVIFSRDQILDHVWGNEISVTDRTIDSHIYTLRKKLGPWSHYVKSVQGEGYRFSEERVF